MKPVYNPLVWVALALIHAYRLTISPLLGDRCKYHPSCSRYALDAYRRYGFVRGTVLTAWRLLRCNPWSRGGVDYAHEQRLFTSTRLRLAPVGETMFPPRAPFFGARLAARGAQVAAHSEENERGNLPVPPSAPSTAHRAEAAR